MGHESIGEDGCVSWLMASDLKLPSEFPHGGRKTDCRWAPVIHVVRSPFDVISSMTSIMKPSLQFLRQNFPCSYKGDDALGWWWVQWNILCAKQAFFRVRVEDLEGDFNRNRRKHRSAAVRDPRVQTAIADLAKAYGYP